MGKKDCLVTESAKLLAGLKTVCWKKLIEVVNVSSPSGQRRAGIRASSGFHACLFLISFASLRPGIFNFAMLLESTHHGGRKVAFFSAQYSSLSRAIHAQVARSSVEP